MHYLIAEYLLAYQQKEITHEHDEKRKKVAVLVESRPSFWLPLVLKNFMDKLEDFNFQLFLTKNAAQLVRQKLPGAELEIIEIEPDRGEHLDVEEYSNLLKTKEFWMHVQSENVLIFQIDALLIEPIPTWAFAFDFIAAPCGTLRQGTSPPFTMNGGLSLRKKSAMLRVLKEQPEPDDENAPEDVYFTSRMWNGEYEMPIAGEAIKFSAESIAGPYAIGIHGTDKYWLKTEDIGKLLNS